MNNKVAVYLTCLFLSALTITFASPLAAEPGQTSTTNRIIEALQSRTPLAVTQTSAGYQLSIGSEATGGDTAALINYLQELLQKNPSEKKFASAVEDFALELSRKSPSEPLTLLLRTARAQQMGLSAKTLARFPSLEKFVVANNIHRSMALFGHSASFNRNGAPTLLLNGQPTAWNTVEETVAVDREGRMMGFAYTADGFVVTKGAPVKSEEMTEVVTAPPVVPEPAPTNTISESPSQPQQSPLELAHNALFEFFNPDSAHLDAQAQAMRKGIQGQIFQVISQNEKLQRLIAPLMGPGIIPNEIAQHYPDFLKGGIAALDIKQRENLLVELRRSNDNQWRNYVWQLRKAYLWMSYPSIYANHLAQVEQTPSTVKEVPFELPESKLRIENGEIVHADGEIDYLIIGSGPAGSLIANELAHQKGLRIVVVEAGSFVKPGSIKTESMSELMESQNQRTNTAGGIAFRNGYAVGGGTTVNLDLAFPPQLEGIRAHLREWIVSNPALREELEDPSTRIGEDEFADMRGTLFNTYEEIERRIGTRQVEASEVNANNRLLFDHISPAAVSSTYKLNQKPIGDATQNGKISAVEVFLLPALKGGEGIESLISIVPDVKTLKVNTEKQNGRLVATGVDVEFLKPWDETFIVKDPNHFGAVPGTKVTIRAKNVIVSAGTLGSAEILLRSNLNNDNIGRGIVIHPSYGMPSLFANEINPHEGLPTSVYAAGPLEEGFYYEAMSADPNFLALIHPGSGEQVQQALKNYKKIGGFGIMLIDTPNRNNRVALNKDGAVEVHYTLNPEDVVRLKGALKKALHSLFKAGAQQILLSSSEPLLSDELDYQAISQDDQVDSAVDRMTFAENLNFVSSAHMQGSNKMGSDPKRSVVSPHLRVWDTKSGREIANFYVMDSSIFPTSIGANPMQSIYTIAKLFTDYVLLKDIKAMEKQQLQTAGTSSSNGKEEISEEQNKKADTKQSKEEEEAVAVIPSLEEMAAAEKKKQEEEAQAFKDLLAKLPKGDVVDPDYTLSSSYHYVMEREDLRKEFGKFLTNIFMRLKEPEFFTLIDSVMETEHTDKSIYNDLSKRIGEAKPNFLFDNWAAYQSLLKQKQVIRDQVKEIMGTGKEIDGYVEIGSPGRYVKPFKEIMNLKGKVTVVKDQPRTVDYLEAGFPLPYDKFVKMGDDHVLTEDDVASESADLVTLMVGLHHVPVERLEQFAETINRMLRPGGVFILRDHNVHNKDMMELVTVVHSVFNAGTGEPPAVDEIEYRNFQPLQYWIDLMERHGFKVSHERLLQEGDPTLNTMVKFVKVARNASEAAAEFLPQVEREVAAQDPTFKRNLYQTYLTGPEWENVAAMDALAAATEDKPLYDYPFFSSLGDWYGVWKNSVAAAREDSGFVDSVFNEFNGMNVFIGATMTPQFAGMGIASLVPHYLDKLADLIVGEDDKKSLVQTYLAEEIPGNNNIFKRYADFIHHTPFHAFPAVRELALASIRFDQAWSKAREEGRSVLDLLTSRQTWRDVYSGTVAAAVFGPTAAVAYPVSAIYGEGAALQSAETIKMIVADPNHQAKSVDSRIEVVKEFDRGLKLVSVPRYMPFVDIVKKLSHSEVQTMDIAGQHVIQVDVKVPAADVSKFTSLAGSKKLYDWNNAGDSSLRKVALKVNVKDLNTVLPELEKRGAIIHYIHDF